MLATTAYTEKWSVPEPVEVATSPLLVFADDWGRHPSSCQHLVRHLLERHRVYWVNTIGTRTPRLDLATLRRGFEKVGQWFRRSAPAEALPANLQVLNPKMWPWCGSAFGRGLNRRLLRAQLVPLLRSLPEPAVAVTTIPIVSDLIGLLPVRRWVYYCVDDFGQWPGLDQATLRHMEGRLIEQADTIIAVSENLQEKLAERGRSSHLLTHGVELEHWRVDGEPADIAELHGVPRPLILFWGVVDRRMDVSFIERLAADLRQGTMVFAGPSADPDPALDRIPRVLRLGPMRFEQLPQLARHAGVLIMPYADLPVTRAIQPLKLKEYLATGRPTVVRDLPATRPWADCLDLADTPESFSRAVRVRLESGLPVHQKNARGRLSSETWTEKARCFERWVLERR
jgi:glycosyltransferase involved in cell wall biosynthesis